MGKEQAPELKENLGIRVPLGPTVVIAAFLSTRDDSQGEHPKIDLTSTSMAVWLTTPKTVGDEVYDFVIDPDGIASAVAIRRSNGQIYIMMTEIKDAKEIETATFLNLPEGADARVIRKVYPKQELWECYTVLTLPENGTERNINEFSQFAGKRTLVSGMKKRGPNLTGLWASRMTDKSNLPFGRELPRKK